MSLFEFPGSNTPEQQQMQPDYDKAWHYMALLADERYHVIKLHDGDHPALVDQKVRSYMMPLPHEAASEIVDLKRGMEVEKVEASRTTPLVLNEGDSLMYSPVAIDVSVRLPRALDGESYLMETARVVQRLYDVEKDEEAYVGFYNTQFSRLDDSGTNFLVDSDVAARLEDATGERMGQGHGLPREVLARMCIAFAMSDEAA